MNGHRPRWLNGPWHHYSWHRLGWNEGIEAMVVIGLNIRALRPASFYGPVFSAGPED